MARTSAPCCELRTLVLHTYPDGIKAYGHERITTPMGWLYVRMNGLRPQVQQIDAASAQGQANPGGPQQPAAGSTAEHITTDFCSRSQGRIDAAVTQGLGILAGLALGSSVQGQEIGK